MIGFPCSPRPSELLWIENLTPQAEDLKEECEESINFARSGDPHRSSDLLYQRAQDLRGHGDQAGCAVALTCLADIACAEGKLGPAFRYSREAMQIFADLPAIEQKHNHAVALYSLGLISQLLGLEREALEHYEKSLAAFEVAKRHWSILPGTDPCVAICQACCADIPLRIEKLMEYVMRARRFEGTTAIRCSLLLGCWPLDPTLVSADQLIVEATVSALTVDMELRHAGNTYKLERPGGAGAPEPVIQPSQEYYVVKIPEDLAQAVWRQDAEYALVCRDMRDSYFGIGTETNKNTPLWGTFIADAEGNMQLRATYEHDFLPWPRLVGESNLDRKMSGSIVGVFRRVNA